MAWSLFLIDVCSLIQDDSKLLNQGYSFLPYLVYCAALCHYCLGCFPHRYCHEALLVIILASSSL